MSRRSLTLAVVGASLIAGACAGRISIRAVPEPFQAQAPEVADVAMLPVRSMTLNDLIVLESMHPVVAAVEPGCVLSNQIDDARALLERVPVSIGSKSYRYTEYRGRTVTFKDSEKTIALAMLDPVACTLSTVTITKRGDKLTSPAGYDIEPVTRTNGIRWNNWATEFKINQPQGAVVVALKYPYMRDERTPRVTTSKKGKRVTVYDTKSVPIAIYYTPYSEELHVPELVKGGEEYLQDLAARVFEDLRVRAVDSQSSPGTLVANLPALTQESVTRLAPIEHMDMSEFLLDPTWTAERIHIVIGANRERVATYTCSSASACGLMQFTSGTYAMMRTLYPAAGLIPDFTEGARDHFNAMKAAVLLHDHNIAQLVAVFGPTIAEDPKLEEYLAAAYNTGVGRVIAVLAVARKKNVADWTDASGSKKSEHLLAETKGYIAKLRFLKEEWRPAPLARAVLSTPDR